MPENDSESGREVLVEAMRLGDVMKVSVLDVATGLEATAIGPPSARADLETIAMGKLRRLLGEKERSSPPEPSRAGRLV